jgi:hypothetical protein
VRRCERGLGAHHYEPRKRQISVEKKGKIKAAIGCSPDFAAEWVGSLAG